MTFPIKMNINLFEMFCFFVCFLTFILNFGYDGNTIQLVISLKNEGRFSQWEILAYIYLKQFAFH